MADIYRRIFKQVHVMLLGALLLVIPAAAHSDTSLISQQRPAETLCRAPLNWYVDEIDPKFGFSRSEVISAVIRATQMWNQAAEIELFNVGEADRNRDAITISLIYDHRQQLQEYIAVTDAQIARLNEQVDELDARLAEERAQLADAREDIEVMNAGIASKAAQVDEMIDQHANRRGQLPRQVAEKINELQSAAQQLVDTHNAALIQFNQRQVSFNNSVKMRNQVAEQQSALVSQRNQRVQNSEVEWQRRGLGTESGRHNIHIRTTNRGVSVADETITIYSASNHLGLVTILAHEFGHVIGIGHVQGAASIMSARLESPTPGAYPQQLSGHDLEALRAVCSRVNPAL